MALFIIFGTRGLRAKGRDRDLLNSCPECSGTLASKADKQWSTLFFIPKFPFQTLESYFECKNCKTAYNYKIKDLIKSGQREYEEQQKRANEVFSEAVVASIDGEFAAEEEKRIKEAIGHFEGQETRLSQFLTSCKKNPQHESFVFNLLLEAKELLSGEGVPHILAQASKVMLADGRIDKEEERLLKEDLLACAMSKDMYGSLIEKVQNMN